MPEITQTDAEYAIWAKKLASRTQERKGPFDGDLTEEVFALADKVERRAAQIQASDDHTAAVKAVVQSHEATIARQAKEIEAKEIVVDACLAWMDSPPMAPGMTDDDVRERLKEDEKIYNALHDTVVAYKAAFQTTENTKQ